MAKLTCPHCTRKVKVPEYVVQVVIRCPGCSQVFQRKVGPQTPPGRVPPDRPAAREEVGPPPRQTPLLTPCHHCQHCGQPIESPVARPAATVVCPSCDNKTSVYAVLHSCPSCRRLLESPSRSAGTETTCPACLDTLRVPHDVLLKETPSWSDEFRFGFYCLACSGEVVAREKDAGTHAVCPHCRVPLVVPHAGHYLGGAGPAPPRDPLDSLHPSKEVPCPNCGTRLPVRASACPACGARPASPSPS